jgi:hypothetical protein
VEGRKDVGSDNWPGAKKQTCEHSNLFDMFGGGTRNCDMYDWEGHPARELFLAAKNNKASKLRALLKSNELCAHVNDLDGEGAGLLHHVCFDRMKYKPKIMEVLLEHGADINLRSDMVRLITLFA